MLKSLVIFIFAFLCTCKAYCVPITLDDYLSIIKENHPLFKKEALAPQIAKEHRDSFKGTKDWRVQADSYYQHQELPPASFGSTERRDSAHAQLGLNKLSWETGGLFSMQYKYNYIDQDNPIEEFFLFEEDSASFDLGLRDYENEVSISYTQPLLKNLGGKLSRLEYQLADHDIKTQSLQAVENQEEFLHKVANRFIDWVELSEKKRILKVRVDISQEQYEQTKRKHEADVVELVDVLRAEDDIWTTRQDLSHVKAQWKAVQTELATLSGKEDLYRKEPSYDLYSLPEPPPITEVLAKFEKDSRVLHSYDTYAAKLKTQKQGIKDSKKADLNLSLGAGLRQSDDTFNDSMQMDEPDLGVALEFSYPLGNTEARQNYKRVVLEEQQVQSAKQDDYAYLKSKLRGVLVQIQELKEVLRYNKRQTESAVKRSKEEMRLYEQGRGEFNFVLQAQDSAQYAYFRYAENAAGYHKLYLNYQSLTDQLVPDLIEQGH